MDSDCPAEISLPGNSLSLVCFVEELQAPPHVRKPARASLGWDSGRGEERHSSLSFWAQPPPALSREAREPAPRA